MSFVGSDDVAVGHTAATRPVRRRWAAKATSSPSRARRRADQPRPHRRPATRRWPSRRRFALLGSGVGSFQQAPARRTMARLLAEHPRDRRRVDRQRPHGLRRARRAGGGRPQRPRWWASTACPRPSTHIEQGTMLASVDFSAFNIAAIAARAALRHLARRARAGADHDAGGADRPHELPALAGAVRRAALMPRGKSRGERNRADMREASRPAVGRIARLARPLRLSPVDVAAAPAASLIDLNSASRDDLMTPRRHRRGAGRRHHPGPAVQGQDRAGRAPADPRGAVRQDRRQGDGAPAARRDAAAGHPSAGASQAASRADGGRPRSTRWPRRRPRARIPGRSRSFA